MGQWATKPVDCSMDYEYLYYLDGFPLNYTMVCLNF